MEKITVNELENLVQINGIEKDFIKSHPNVMQFQDYLEMSPDQRAELKLYALKNGTLFVHCPTTEMKNKYCYLLSFSLNNNGFNLYDSGTDRKFDYTIIVDKKCSEAPEIFWEKISKLINRHNSNYQEDTIKIPEPVKYNVIKDSKGNYTYFLSHHIEIKEIDGKPTWVYNSVGYPGMFPYSRKYMENVLEFMKELNTLAKFNLTWEIVELDAKKCSKINEDYWENHSFSQRDICDYKEIPEDCITLYQKLYQEISKRYEEREEAITGIKTVKSKLEADEAEKNGWTIVDSFINENFVRFYLKRNEDHEQSKLAIQTV